MESASMGTGSTGRPPGLATQFLSVPGGAIAYDDSGAGRVVICVPSLGDVRAEYRFLRPALVSSGFRVVTMDLRGHGESSVGFRDHSAAAVGSDVLALARHLDAGPVSIIGTSMAAGSALWTAAEAPEIVDKLVLISPVVRAQGGDTFLKMAVNLLLLRPWGPSFWTTYFPNFFPGPKPPDFDAYRARLKANLREPGRVEAVKAVIDSPNDMQARLDSVNAPSLVIMGARDPDFKDPAGEARWLGDQINARVLIVDGAGHYPHAQMPEKVVPEIEQFLSAAKKENAA